MTDRTYSVELTDGQRFVFRADMAEASAGIGVNFHDPGSTRDWQVTPYQTADARHSPWQAAELLAEHYATDSGDCVDVDTVEPLSEED